MKISIVVAALAAALLVTVLVHQRRGLGDLRAEEVRLRDRIAEGEKLEAERRDLVNVRRTAEQVERLRGEQEELQALREETATLKAEIATRRKELTDAIAAAEAEARAARAREAEARDAVQAAQARREAATRLRQLSMLMMVRARASDGVFPGALQELADLGMPVTANDLEMFERVPATVGVDGAHPSLPILREREARRLDDGTWERGYGFADGSSRMIASPGPDFSSQEAEWIGQAAAEAVFREDAAVEAGAQDISNEYGMEPGTVVLPGAPMLVDPGIEFDELPEGFEEGAP